MARIDEATLAALTGVATRAGLVGAPNDDPSRPLRFEPLPGGLGRRTYLAVCGEREWVIRLAREERPGAIDLEIEAAVTAAAASLGIAPRVIATDLQAGALVTEHLRGARTLERGVLTHAEGVSVVADLLRLLHTLRMPLRPFEPEGFAAQYLAGPCAEERLTREQRALAAELRLLARAYRMRFPSIVLCHNDLVAANLLDDGRLRLIDFEYAVMAAPVLDLAGLAALNDLDSNERWQLAETYYRPSAVPFTPAEFGKVVRLVRLMGYFWALQAAAAAPNRAPYDAFAAHAVNALVEGHC